MHNGSISMSYSTGRIDGVGDIGGLVGCNYSKKGVDNSYSSCAVTGDDQVGGLVGDNSYGQISCSYSIGAVVGSDHVGGVAGYNGGNGITDSSFWDTETSGLPLSAGGTGLSTVKMKDINTYLDAGWDFVDETENGIDNIWKMPSDTGYPVLAQVSPVVIEDFENGFEVFEWDRSVGDASWFVTTRESFSSNRSAQAGNVIDDEISTLKLTCECNVGNLSFWVKVSSEPKYDSLVFRVDRQELGRWSGEQEWTHVSYPVTADVHTFEWSYEKDSSEFGGDDTAWIDDVAIPLRP